MSGLIKQRRLELGNRLRDLIRADQSSGKGAVLAKSEVKQLAAIAARLTGEGNV